jgi:phosphoribosylaminoimidazole-succinocarboxamide synthase
LEEIVETTPEKLEMFYEGKAKKLYSTPDPDLVIAYFKDDATAFNAKKRGTIEDKGVINNRMSELFFTLLEHNGVKTHFVRRLNDRDMLCKRLDIIPVETVVRNIVAGSMARRLGREEGEVLPHPVVEYYYKSDPLDDPLISPSMRCVFGWATAEELKTIDALALKVNDVLGRSSTSAGSCWSISSSNSAAITARFCSATKSVPTPAASGTRPRVRSSTRIASAATSATSRRPTRRCSGGSRNI